MVADSSRDVLVDHPPPKRLRALVAMLDMIVGEGTGRLVATAVLPMIFAPVYEVVARYLFHAPTSWSYDVT